MSALIVARAAGVAFTFNRHHRVISPMLRFMHRGTVTKWGLRAVDVTIEAGEGIALIGPTGSGKSTLLRLFAGVLRPDRGSVSVTGRVGTLLSHDAGLLQPLSGHENVECLAIVAGVPRKDLAERIAEIKQTSRLGEAFEEPVSSYSLGMRARLGFALAHAVHPSIMLLDEMHDAFDAEFWLLVEERVRELRSAGGIVVAAGHDLDRLARMCDRAIMLSDGRVVADAPFEELAPAPRGRPTPRSALRVPF